MKSVAKWALRPLAFWMMKVPVLRDAMKEVRLEHSYFSHFSIHEQMLADRVRMDTYSRAIDKHVNRGDVVLDLGTGSGILTFLATLREPKKIYAVEASRAIEMAKCVAAHNNFGNIIFLNKHSKDVNIPEKVDLILHEQMSSFLFQEEIIENILDVRRRLLKPNGRILPSKFEVFVEPVKLKDDCTVPLIWEHEFFNFSCLKKFQEKRVRVLEPYEVDYFLCDPEKVLSFDLEKISDDNFMKKISFKKQVKRRGRFDGFCFYFRTIFDEEISFSTSPLEQKTHWKSRLLACEAKEFSEGAAITFEMIIKDASDVNTWEWRYEHI
jgi:protein arginine N-methyltransferase 1